MNLKALVTSILQYKKDKDSSQLPLIEFYKMQIKQDVISAYEMSELLIDENKKLFLNSPSFISFLFQIINIETNRYGKRGEFTTFHVRSRSSLETKNESKIQRKEKPEEGTLEDENSMEIQEKIEMEQQYKITKQRLKELNDILETERGTFKRMKKGLEIQNQTLEEKNKFLEREKTSLKMQNETLESECSKLQKDNKKLRSDKVKFEHDKEMSENKSFQSEQENKNLKTEISKLKEIMQEESNEMSTQSTAPSLTFSQHYLKHDVFAHTADLRNQLDVCNGDKNKLHEQIKILNADNKNLHTHLEHLKTEFQTLETEFSQYKLIQDWAKNSFNMPEFNVPQFFNQIEGLKRISEDKISQPYVVEHFDTDVRCLTDGSSNERESLKEYLKDEVEKLQVSQKVLISEKIAIENENTNLKSQLHDLNRLHKVSINDLNISERKVKELTALLDLLTNLNISEQNNDDVKTILHEINEKIVLYNEIVPVIEQIYEHMFPDTIDTQENCDMKLKKIKSNIEMLYRKPNTENISQSVDTSYSIEDVTTFEQPFENKTKKLKRENLPYEFLQKELEAKSEIIAELNRTLERQKYECDEKIADMESKVLTCEEAITQLNLQFESLAQQKQTLTADRDTYKETNEELKTKINQLINEKNMDLKVDQLANLASENKTLKEIKKSLEIEINRLKDEISTKEKEEIQAKQSLVEKANQLSMMEVHTCTLRTTNESLVKTIATSNAEIERLKNEIQTLAIENEKIKQKNITHEHDIIELKKINELCNNQIQNKHTVVLEMDQTIQKTQRSLTETLREVEVLRAEKNDLKTQTEQCFKKIEALKQKEKNMKHEVSQRSNDPSTHHESEERIIENLTICQENNKKLSQNLKMSELSYNNLKIKYENLESEHEKYEREIKSLQKKIEKMRIEYEELQKERNEFYDDNHYLKADLFIAKKRKQVSRSEEETSFKFKEPIYHESYEEDMLIGNETIENLLDRCIKEKDRLTIEIEKLKEHSQPDSMYVLYTEQTETLNVTNLKLLFLAFFKHHFKLLNEIYQEKPISDPGDILSNLKELLENLKRDTDMSTTTEILHLYIENQINTLTSDITQTSDDVQNIHTINDLLQYAQNQTKTFVKQLRIEETGENFLRRYLHDFLDSRVTTKHAIHDIVSILIYLKDIFDTNNIEDLKAHLFQLKDLLSKLEQKLSPEAGDISIGYSTILFSLIRKSLA